MLWAMHDLPLRLSEPRTLINQLSTNSMCASACVADWEHGERIASVAPQEAPQCRRRRRRKAKGSQSRQTLSQIFPGSFRALQYRLLVLLHSRPVMHYSFCLHFRISCCCWLSVQCEWLCTRTFTCTCTHVRPYCGLVKVNYQRKFCSLLNYLVGSVYLIVAYQNHLLL